MSNGKPILAQQDEKKKQIIIREEKGLAACDWIVIVSGECDWNLHVLQQFIQV